VSVGEADCAAEWLFGTDMVVGFAQQRQTQKNEKTKNEQTETQLLNICQRASCVYHSLPVDRFCACDQELLLPQLPLEPFAFWLVRPAPWPSSFSFALV
jgi:hypothetical protein